MIGQTIQNVNLMEQIVATLTQTSVIALIVNACIGTIILCLYQIQLIPHLLDQLVRFLAQKINISRNFQMYNIDCWQLVGVGDGICDDQANTLECNYDGGDCCMGIKGLYCIQCICKDTYTGYPLLTTTPFNWHGWFKSLKKCQK